MKQTRLLETTKGNNTKEKLILDASSGFRSMWLNKDHPNTIFLDIRNDEKLAEDMSYYLRMKKRNPHIWSPTNPTFQGDYRQLPFPDNSFHLIVFDPPHFKSVGERAMFRAKYGYLNPETWQEDLRAATRELWRVLKPCGILVVKWSTHDIKWQDVLRLFPARPLFGNRSTSKGPKATTFWFCFMKILGEMEVERK